MKKWLLLLFLPSFLLADVALRFPIAPDSDLKFHIIIPSTFEEVWRAPNNKMVEYIPQGEALESWTEIITVETLPKQIGMLEFYLRKHKIAIETVFMREELSRSEISTSEENSVPIGFAHYRNPHFQVATQTVDNNYTECMGMKVVQGKYHLYRVAYNIKFPKDSPHKPIEDKIETYLASCKILADKPSDE